MGVSADWDGTRGCRELLPGEGTLFHRLGAALVHLDPDQMTALHAQTESVILLSEPERIVHAIQVGEAASVSPGTEVSEATDTWGLQSTKVTSSRFSGRRVRVAILDTGLDLGHPDFIGRSITSQCFVNGASVDDVNGHGTYCAGIACGPSAPTHLGDSRTVRLEGVIPYLDANGAVGYDTVRLFYAFNAVEGAPIADLVIIKTGTLVAIPGTVQVRQDGGAHGPPY